MQKTNKLNNERCSEIISIIEKVCKDNLNEEYLFLAENLCKEIFNLDSSKLNKGKANSWACGIVHSIGLKNGLFTNKSSINIKAADFYKLFEVSSSTGLSKSKEVRSILDLDNEKWVITSKSENQREVIEEENTTAVVNENKDVSKEDVESSLEEVAACMVENIIEAEEEIEILEDEALKKANEIVNEAWNQKNYNKKVKLAKEALKISDKCAEAYIILSYDNSLTNEEQKKLAVKAVEVAKEVIGEGNIDKFIGKYLESEITKAYYSAKYRLGNLLWSFNERIDAINELLELIRLFPEDRLLIRNSLLSWVITEGLDNETEKLLSMFKNDYLTSTKFSKALYLFKKGNIEDAERALRIANAFNPFVVSYITKQKKVPKVQPELKNLGSEEEAIYYIKNANDAWDSVEGSRNWVKEIKNRL